MELLTNKEGIPAPKLSVIVVSFNPWPLLKRCLTALTAQGSAQEIEILAIGRWSGGQQQKTRQSQFPQVRWISVPVDYTIPLMRSCGIMQSQGEIAALLEDDCIVAQEWCRGIIKAHQNGSDAIGGPIEPGLYEKSMDWAIYFCEYGRFMRPFSGPVATLPGNNVSYKKAALTDLQEGAGFYEVMLHWQWQQDGKVLQACDDLVVHNVNSWSLVNVTTSPYHHGRAFAGMRVSRQPWYRRLFFAGISLALPLIQVLRQMRIIIFRRRYTIEYVRALPWTLVFLISWSLGEFVGYLRGPGQSASHWR